MNKVRKLWDLIFEKNEQNIYRLILRTAIWGSILTFLAMGAISLCSMIVLHNVMNRQGISLSENVGTYLEDSLKEDVQSNLMETNMLRAELVGRTLKGCFMNSEFMSHRMTDILQNNDKYVPVSLPIANDGEIPDKVPYVYYTRELLSSGIGEDIHREISYACSIADDMKNISRSYYNDMLAASKNGYVVRLDLLDDDDRGAVLSYEPLKSSYSFLNSYWYETVKQENRLVLTNPYMASYGEMCISIGTPYYDNDGFAGVILVDINSAYIEESLGAMNKDVSQFSFIMGRNGEILITPYGNDVFSPDMKSDLRKSENASIAETAKHMTSGETGIALIEADDTEYYLAYAPIADTGWSIGTVSNKADILEDADQLEAYTIGIIERNGSELQYFFLIMGVLSILLFVVVLYPILRANVMMTRGIAEPIVLLTRGVQEIAKGNLDKKLSIKTGNEIETLADSFNHMTDELKIYIENLTKTTTQKERIEAELSFGARIQAGMLPNGIHPFGDYKEFDLSALMHPAKEVGGDFYDFYFIDEHHLAITVADVSGKGVPAALFMVIAKTLLKDEVLFDGDKDNLGKIFEKVNNALVKSNEENMFVTVFVGILDIRTGDFVYVNAGHNPPVLKRSGKWSYISKAENTVMGMIEDLEFKSGKFRLKQGDAVFLYTDGVTEARNSQKEFFGEKRLLKAVEAAGADAATDINSVAESVKQFAGDAVQSDDITMLEVIYYGSSTERNDSK